MKLSINGFKIGKSAEFNFDSSFNEIKSNLNMLQIAYEEDYSREKDLYFLVINSLNLVFDKNKTFCGFFNTEVNFNCTEDIGINITDNDGDALQLDLIDWNTAFCKSAIDLDTYYENNKDKDIPKLEGWIHYCKEIFISDKKCLLQITETYNIDETISLLREDIVEKLPIEVISSEKKSVNLTDLVLYL